MLEYNFQSQIRRKTSITLTINSLQTKLNQSHQSMNVLLLEIIILRAFRRPDSVKYYPNKEFYKEIRLLPNENDLVKYSLRFIDREKCNGASILKYYARLGEEYINSLIYHSSKPSNFS